MTDRSADIDALGLPVRRPPARRLGRGARLAVSGAVALALTLILALAWLQITVLSGLPATASLKPPPGPPATAADAAAGDRLAPELADQLLPTQAPPQKRALQREVLALRLRRELRPDEIRRLYLERTRPAATELAQEGARRKFYQALANDFAEAEHPKPGLRTGEE